MATTLSLLRFAPLPPRLTRSSITINLTPFPNRAVRISRPCAAPSPTSYALPAIRRGICILAYTVPFLNLLPFGRHIQSRYPFIASLTSPFMAYQHAPLLNFLAFIVFFFLLALNPDVNRFLRINAMQAVTFDKMLTFVELVESLVGTPSSRIELRFQEFCNGVIFVLGVETFVYCVLCCLFGHTPHLSFITSSSMRVLGFTAV